MSRNFVARDEGRRRRSSDSPRITTQCGAGLGQHGVVVSLALLPDPDLMISEGGDASNNVGALRRRIELAAPGRRRIDQRRLDQRQVSCWQVSCWQVSCGEAFCWQVFRGQVFCWQVFRRQNLRREVFRRKVFRSDQLMLSRRAMRCRGVRRWLRSPPEPIAFLFPRIHVCPSLANQFGPTLADASIKMKASEPDRARRWIIRPPPCEAGR